MKQPNILVIFTDMQRADTVGALGNEAIRTPQLDRLVREGTAFTSAYSPSPVCVPARCCVQYGLYPHRTGCFENEPMMADNGRSYPAVPGRAGYRTRAIGKCHFTPDGNALRGFQSRQHQEEGRSDPRADDYVAWLAANGTWKYVYSAGEDREFMFDRRRDPRETANAADSPACAASKEALNAEYLKYVKACGQADTFTETGAGLDWKRYPRVSEEYLKDPDAELLFQDHPGYRRGYAIDRKGMPRESVTPVRRNANGPAGVYNAMVAPLIPYGIRGAIRYQGESNAGRAWEYRSLLPTMIEGWRKEWGLPPSSSAKTTAGSGAPGGDFPFLIVQLANHMGVKAEPSESAWAELREAQALTEHTLTNCGLAVAIDIGDAADIHPKNKQEVGRRLGLVAEKVAYGRELVFSGPVFESASAEGGKMRLKFRHVGGGLVAKGEGGLKGFAVAGEDRKFAWADAAIDGATVVVSSTNVPAPVAARYAWADNPVCNLYSKEGLPAVPFRTDDWPGVTWPKKK